MVASAENLLTFDQPMTLRPGHSTIDRIFHGTVRTVAAFMLVIFGAIGIFLALKLPTTIHFYKFRFLTTSSFDWDRNEVGILSAVAGTFEVALVALTIALPMAMATALYISEYAPTRFKSTMVGVIDLMAAVPSIVYGVWGFFFLSPKADHVSRWIAANFGWIPIFKVNTDPNSATWAESRFVGSAFIAGVVVSMMVIPIACSVMRGVFAQAPVVEREAALALGSTKWGMIRTVVIPFGRGGIIGGTMLGLGRALGETIAVILVISVNYDLSAHILQNGTITISSFIANAFGAANPGAQLNSLLAAGFVLFVLTLVVNTVAAVFVTRSRSGSATD
jgi:phosphate transport system permease protein